MDWKVITILLAVIWLSATGCTRRVSVGVIPHLITDKYLGFSEETIINAWGVPRSMRVEMNDGEGSFLSMRVKQLRPLFEVKTMCYERDGDVWWLWLKKEDNDEKWIVVEDLFIPKGCVI